MSSTLKFGHVARIAVGAAAATVGAVPIAAAQEAAPTAGGPQADGSDATLQEVVVTGSRIRRTIDEATAAPITVIDSSTIAATGYGSVGDVLQQIPGIAGAATTPATNNGGGFGEANVELRGLDAKRTLVLIDGRRVGVAGGPGSSGATDINAIPVSIIDHVDVLKEGAGAIYGSDAIAGVVNFVTKKHTDGLEIGGDYGRTSKDDGEHYTTNLLWGGTTDKFDFLVSGTYFKQDGVSADKRKFSKDALYLYSGSSGRFVSAAGSSRVPTGRASLPAASAAHAFFTNPPNTAAGCTGTGTYQVTRNDGTAGTSLADYRCLDYSYNYQPFNLVLTPQERGTLFASSTYHVTDDIDAYAEVLWNKTHSGFQIAPLPFDASADDVIVSATNPYNAFGLDFGGLQTTNSNYRTRFTSLGNRFSRSDTDSKLTNIGLKGKLPFNDWQWDANIGYNRQEQRSQTYGYVYFPGLRDEVGPAYAVGDGTFGCGTDAAHAIPNCTPINFFNVDDPATIAALQNLSTSFHTESAFVYKSAALDFNGGLFQLPAGEVRAAVGFQYQDQNADFVADKVVQADAPLFITCLISGEACTGDSSGGYNTKEVYAEALIPILKDLPGAQLLNFDVGIRHSKYSLFGSTTRSQFKVEYKPINDLLLRGTYAQVFRAPTLIDLFAAPLNSSSTFSDPCYGSTTAGVAGNPGLARACNNAYQLEGDFSYPGTSQVTGLITSNPDLKPEKGDVATIGFVYQIPFIKNLSLTADYWRYKIKNVITTLDVNYSIQQCIATNADDFCNLITRFPAGNNQGQVEVFVLPTVNLGQLKTDGVDADLNYSLRDTAAGTFRFALNGTFINKYQSYPLPGAGPQEVAGTYDRQFGNYARYRGLFTVGWNLLGFEGQLQSQYIHRMVIHTPATQTEGRFGTPNPDLKIPSIVYFNASLGYNVKQTGTHVMFGVQNIANKQPPLLYQNNVVNANTDVSTYDTVGRRYFLSLLQKF